MDDFKQKPVPQSLLDPTTKLLLQPSGFKGFLVALGQFYTSNKYYVWAILIGLAVIGALAFFAFRPRTVSPTAAKVDFSIDGPETAASGGEAVYKIKIENKDSSTLTNMEVEAIYPSGASYLSSQPAADTLSGTVFSIPDLISGQNAVVIIKVRLQGNVNDEKKFLARLHYRYRSFNSDFTAETESTTRLVASDVALELTGPSTTNNAQLVEYSLDYKNNSDADIENARIQIKYPSGFVYADSVPKPDLGKDIWNIGRLAKDAGGTITFQGNFKDSQPGEQKPFVASLLVLDENGSYFTQGTGEFTTTISSLPLVVSQELSTQFKDGIAKPGDTLQYTVKYQNNGTVVAQGVNIVISLDSKALDFSTIKAQGAEVNNDTISWNASAMPNLETLNPSESGTVTFSVGVRNPAVKDSSTNVTVTTRVKIKSNEYQTFLPGNDLVTKISSPSSLSGGVDYVSGSLPPAVGKITTYRITLSLKNATNDYSDGILTAFLPLSANAFDASSVLVSEARAVTYDSATGKLTWKVGKLDAHSGGFKPIRKLSFNVQINPSSDQVNQEVLLLKTIVFSGTDSFTGQKISLKAEDISTGDIPNAGAKGRVVK